ncbi:MAG: phosphate ABC transporter substrate-binding protein [Chlorobium sp.]|nr:phosphate ABC transporter substrate-binding protein [Chlorobium phaeovibrioides]NQU46544.1 phosphate ABC transporter substrate-binding protein [Chlorobium sp.]
MKRILLLLTVLLFASVDAGAVGGGVVIDGSTTVGPIAKSFAAYFKNRYGVGVTVSESGSGNGVKSLINGTCDIAAMSRAMKSREISAAATKGVNPIAHTIALDGIAIVVHPSNPVASLTRAQIAAIYEGRITSWAGVGGPNVRIVLVQRESNSGTQGSFGELVMGKGVRITRSAETHASNGAVKNRVSSTPGAIGFLGLGFVDGSVKVLAVNGVRPSLPAIRNGSYPVSRPLYMYTNGQPAGLVKQFIDFAGTAEGMRIVGELGFIAQ